MCYIIYICTNNRPRHKREILVDARFVARGSQYKRTSVVTCIRWYGYIHAVWRVADVIILSTTKGWWQRLKPVNCSRRTIMARLLSIRVFNQQHVMFKAISYVHEKVIWIVFVLKTITSLTLNGVRCFRRQKSTQNYNCVQYKQSKYQALFVM